jgi:hypothetical protein
MHFTESWKTQDERDRQDQMQAETQHDFTENFSVCNGYFKKLGLENFSVMGT